ncbi:6-phosphofructokinase [Pseudoalteromonas sp. T1lg65]|uniref:6-phosphofructokinase n=1 Tax=Pseudoalteromonas sp. T1lg65 TaxID=2077101 RepID=UPI003F78FF46
MTRRVAILTSGGDAPGMNAAIRSIALAAQSKGHQCIGFLHGYNGLIEQEHITLTKEYTTNIAQLGGTILKSARCKDMHSINGVSQAANSLRKLNIDDLIVIGGDGSFKGMQALSAHWQGNLIGLPGTIDNDLSYCDNTIGFSTAVNTAMAAIDKIRDTANAFERVFITEVMGRHSGHIAYHVGIASEAEAILSFENFTPQHKQQTLEQLSHAIQTQQACHGSFLIVLAENLWPGGPTALKDELNLQPNVNAALCVLGHIQRGGSPSSEDRMLATELGLAAVEYIDQPLFTEPVMLSKVDGQLSITPIKKVLANNKTVSEQWVEKYKHYLSTHFD